MVCHYLMHGDHFRSPFGAYWEVRALNVNKRWWLNGLEVVIRGEKKAECLKYVVCARRSARLDVKLLRSSGTLAAFECTPVLIDTRGELRWGLSWSLSWSKNQGLGKSR